MANVHITGYTDRQAAQLHIAAHCRDGQYNPDKSVDDNISSHNIRCLVGMIETGDITTDDLQAVGGIVLAAAVVKLLEKLQDRN